MLEADYVIVGGGTAGCTLASRLSENPAARVMLIEAGPVDRSPLFDIPAGVIKVMGDPRYNWGYVTEPQSGMANRRLPMIQARVLGGGSAINGMIYTRGAASDYDSWAELGLEDWGYDRLLPYFLKSERSERICNPFHGREGLVATSQAQPALGVVEDILMAMEQRCYPIVDDLNQPQPDGFGRYDWWIGKGRRSSASASFPGIRGGRRNLHVRTGAVVSRLIVENGRVTGIELRERSLVKTIRAAREVVLCAGAIGSAKLLLLSGIGSADALRALGINVVLDNPNVGRNLANHVSFRLEYRYGRPTTARRYLQPLPGALELLRYTFGRRGFLAHGSAPLGGFFRSDPALDHPDMQLFVTPLLFEARPGVLGMLPREHGFSLSISQGVPFSAGAMWLRSADLIDAPAIDPASLTDPRDVEIKLNAIERMRELVRAPALAPHILSERAPGRGITNRAQLEQNLRANGRPYFHPVGTCRMGRSILDSVTDNRLRVHEVAGLRIADASVMPRLVNGNLNAAAMMIAERAADFIRSD